MAKKLSGFGIALAILLVIRLISSSIISFLVYPPELLYIVLFSSFIILYALALIGVLTKASWGSILVIVIAVFDIAIALFSIGTAPFATIFGAIIMDLILILFSYKEYKNIKRKKS